MGETSYVQPSFLGGEWSQTYQGRVDDPHYRVAMNVCLNGFPTEQGAWTRRSGTQHLGATKGGGPGRVMSFAVEESTPINMEFTDAFVRFRIFDGSSIRLVTTNDAQTILAISTANPAVVTTASAHGWSTGEAVIFSNLGINNPMLQPPRRFGITVTGSTTFLLQDALTNSNIDGSALGTFVSGTVSRILQFSTPYTDGLWSQIISIQAENQAVLVSGTTPELLTMVTPPGPTSDPTFTFAPVNFIDGPYLDPFNGSICTYDVLTGNVTLTFAFATYSAAISYSIGDYVVSGGQGYKSLQNANLNNTPASSPTFWTPVSGGDPIGPHGFTQGDIGRHIRLFSEPSAWASGTTYSSGNVVKYNGAYYKAIAGSTGVAPDSDVTKWLPVTGATYARWTWGRIISISGAGLESVSAPIGNFTNNANAFNGTISQSSSTAAHKSATATSPYILWASGANYPTGTYVYYNGGIWYWPAGVGSSGTVPGTSFWRFISASSITASIDAYLGADFHTSAKAVQQVTVIPSTNLGFGAAKTTFNLRAKASAPISASDGTLLGSVANISQFAGAQTIISSDQITTWGYIWVEIIASTTSSAYSITMTEYIAQVQIFSPNVNNGSVVTIQLAGPALLYTAGTVVNTWRAGVYSSVAGFPTCGCYHEGRLWLGGAIANRWDASESNNLFTFSPTGPDGTVADDNAIAFTADSDGVNTTFWMTSKAEGIIVGTEGGEWLIQATTQGLALSPSNMQAHPVTRAKCADIEPARTEHTLAVVQRKQRKILEHFADVYSGKFSAPNLMMRSLHLSANLIQEIRYQQELTPTIWARATDGSWFGITYKRDTLMTSQGPTFYGAHQHQLGSGRVVESIAVGPSQNGALDALIMVTNDPATNVRHVEVLTDFFEENDNFQQAWLLDDAVAPSSYTIDSSSLTINGLWHLNGKTVQVFVGGLDLGMQNNWPFGPDATLVDFTVSNGSLTIAYGDGFAAGPGNGLFTQAFCNSFAAGTLPIVVGFTYTSQGQLLRPASPAESGARAGPAVGKFRRHHRYAIQCVQTNGIFVGTDFSKLDPIAFRDDAADSYPLPNLFTGVLQDNIEDDTSLDSKLCWQITRPVPALVAAIAGFVETTDV